MRAPLEPLFDQGEKDELLKIGVGMLGETLSRNDELTWRLQAALKLLGRKKSERISKEQLALFLAKLTEEQAKLAETPATETPATETPATETPATETPATETPAAETVGAPAATPSSTPKTPHKKPFPEHLRREIVPVLVSDDKRHVRRVRRAEVAHGLRHAVELGVQARRILHPRGATRKARRQEVRSGGGHGRGDPQANRPRAPGTGPVGADRRVEARRQLAALSTDHDRRAERHSPRPLDDRGLVCPRGRPARAARGSRASARPRHLATSSASTTRACPCSITSTPKASSEGTSGRISATRIVSPSAISRRPGPETSPGEALAQFKGAVVQGDGYAGINGAFVGRSPPLTRAGCMDHCRRTFVPALDAGDARAAIALHPIGGLYAIEADARAACVDLDELGRRRSELAKPVMLCLHRAVADLHAVVEPKSPLGKATFYAINPWDTLSVYLDDPRVPLSNPHVERNQRKTALPRKNALFAGSDEGARRLATRLTILTHGWLHRVPTFDYLRDLLAKLVNTRFKGRLDDLLPCAWLATRLAAGAGEQK